MADTPCPLCGRPISDTAYVCHLCVIGAQSDLRRVASGWHHLEATIARQVAAEGSVRGPGKQRTLHGPVCRGMTCGEKAHESCDKIWKSRHRALTEPPLAHEDAPPANLSASEDAWVVRNTAVGWARHISETRGIDVEPPRPTTPLTVVADPHDTDRAERCHWSDLLIDQCACGHDHHQESA